ncbi:ribonuclease H-like domain-containing protein [Tanacetum coccineum]
MESQSETTQTVSALKLPILKTGDYDLWSMRMEQYLTHTDYALWEVIVNGDAPAIASASTEGPIPPKTAEQKLARKNELKAKSTLLLAIPDEHLLKFHGIKDAKTLWEAIKTQKIFRIFISNKKVSCKNAKGKESKRCKTVGIVAGVSLPDKTIGELHALLIEYEKCLPKKAAAPQVLVIQGGRIKNSNKKSQNAKGKGKGKGKGKDKLVYSPKPKHPKPLAKEHLEKDGACHHCKKVGHWKRNCHVYLAELMKKKMQLGIASSSGNGIRAQVEAIRSFDLHHCLAHISKKRIEMLQHDGLLKSTDDEPFDQCISCLSACLVDEVKVMDDSLVAKESINDSVTSLEQLDESTSSRNECSKSGNEKKGSNHESISSRNDVDDDIRLSYDNDTMSEVYHDMFENVSAHGIQNHEQPKSISDTYMVNENNSNIISDIPNMDPDRHKEEHDYVDYEQHRAFFAFSIYNLKCDVEKCNEVNREAQQVNALLTNKLERYKEKEKNILQKI